MGLVYVFPPRAQVAGQQAKFLADHFRREFSGKPGKIWAYTDFGSLVSLGKFSTVRSLLPDFSREEVFLEGTFAKFMYVMLYKFHEYLLFGLLKTVLLNISRGFSSRIKS